MTTDPTSWPVQQNRRTVIDLDQRRAQARHANGVPVRSPFLRPVPDSPTLVDSSGALAAEIRRRIAAGQVEGTIIVRPSTARLLSRRELRRRLTLDEAAHVGRVSIEAVHTWTRLGSLPTTRRWGLGRRRVQRSDLELQLAAARTAADAARSAADAASSGP